jgi:arsenate reductase
MKKRVLFLCMHNSARSQMAEAYLNKFGSDKFEVESAGFKPAPINPLVIEVLLEDGIDISSNPTKAVFDLFKAGHIFHYVIRVCNIAAQEQCPIFPSMAEMIDWSFDDPSTFTGSHEEKLVKVREVRDKIKAQVKMFAEQMQLLEKR